MVRKGGDAPHSVNFFLLKNRPKNCLGKKCCFWLKTFEYCPLSGFLILPLVVTMFPSYLINNCACQCIAIPVLVVVCREEPGVVTLLHDQVGNRRLIVRLQLLARLPDRHQLLGQHREKLPLRHPVSKHDQPLWLPPIVSLIKLLEQRHRDVLHVLDHFFVFVLSSILDPHLQQRLGTTKQRWIFLKKFIFLHNP